MELRTLRYLAAAVRHESITKAAAELNIAQPALSRQIRLLEEELGVPLLVRHRRGVKATREGLHFVESAEALLRQAQKMRDEVRTYSSAPMGQVRFGFLPAIGDLFAGELAAEFMCRFPSVSFLLREGLTEELTDALLADKIDLAIMIYSAQHRDLYRKPLFAEDIWLAGAPSIWPFEAEPLRIEQLVDIPLVHAALVGSTLERIAMQNKLRFRSVIEGGSRTAARAAVRAGAGFTLMPASWVAEEIGNGCLVGAPVKGLDVERGLFWRADRPQSRAVIEFVESIEQAVAQLKVERSDIIRDIARSK